MSVVRLSESDRMFIVATFLVQLLGIVATITMGPEFGPLFGIALTLMALVVGTVGWCTRNERNGIPARQEPARTESVKAIDSWEGYEIIQITQPGQSPHCYLRMENPTTGETHIEAVPPNRQTVREALQWRNGDNLDTEVLT